MTPEEEAVGGAPPAPSTEASEAAPDPLDVESLLHPVSEAEPAGADLRYEGTYDRIQEARRADDPSLPQGVWERGLKKADWGTVLDLTRDALIHRTKDVQIAVWYLEAALHLEGFAGVSAGLRLLVGLCRSFWADLHPRMEAGELEARVAPFVWMNEKLAFELKQIAITQPGRGSDADPYTFADWEWAERLENLAERDRGQYERAISEGKVTRAKFLGSVMFSPADFYEQQEKALIAAQARLRELADFLDEQCGQSAAPSFRQFHEVLDRIRDLTRNFLAEKRENAADEPAESGASPAEPPLTAPAEPGGNQTGALQIRSRAEAYRILSAVADYLLIHEPHSPTPYLVKRAVSWGHMTLTELLHELIQDEHDLNQIFKLLGLQGPSHPGGEYDGY